MRVLIITGGSSSERKISFMSAKNVKEGLEEKGHRVKLYDFKKGKDKLKELVKEVDIIFPVIHGKEGEDGTLYDLLKKFGIPFVGCEPRSSEIAFDKILFLKFCDKIKIPHPQWRIVKNTLDIKKFGFPSVLKAARGGSSKEVIILLSEKDLKKPLVKKILSLDDNFLVESYVKGVEITVAVFFNKALPIIEIIPPEKGWFDYENKYNGKTQEIVGAPSLNEKNKRKAQEIALKIHKALQLDPYSRTDLIISDSTPKVLEVNPQNGVGMTKESLLPKAAKAVGISFPKLLDKIIKMSYN